MYYLLLLQLFIRSPGSAAMYVLLLIVLGSAPVPGAAASAASRFDVCGIDPRASMVIMQINSSQLCIPASES